MRMIKPGFFLNEQLADLSPWARLLFAGLWCVADREGRLEDRPRKIKAEVFPYDDVKVDELLDALKTAGFILRYSGDGHAYIQVVNFTKHQSPHSREVPSAIPAPTQEVTEHDLGSDKASPRRSLYSNFIQNTDTERESAAQSANGVAQPLQKKATHSASRSLAEKKKPPEPVPREPRPRNPIWDTLTEVLHTTPSTRTEQSNWGKVVRELAEANATPEEIRTRAKHYVMRYHLPLTINAIAKHWGSLAEMPAVNGTGGLSDAEAGRYLAEEREAKKRDREAAERRRYEEVLRIEREQAEMDQLEPGHETASG